MKVKCLKMKTEQTKVMSGCGRVEENKLPAVYLRTELVLIQFCA